MINQESPRYQSRAESARKQGINGQFELAFVSWSAAAESALCGQNRHWAQARADHCRAKIAIQRRAQEMQGVVHV
ncbi:ANR family transcriptional regulator [Vibrio parahaemolyticus]|nr:ANR family transcriptional regulator [Vibrio parahaemolyticus]